MSLYAYAGSNPVNRRDPLGLFYDPFEEADDIAFSILGERAAAAGALTAQVGMAFNMAQLIGGMAFSFLPGADALKLALMLARGEDITFSDVLWAASDFAGPVAKLTRKFFGAMDGYRLGARAQRNFSHGIQAAEGAMRGVEHLFKRMPYKEAQKLTAGADHAIEAHHIIEARHLKNWGLDTASAPAVILSGPVHNELTQALRTALPYGNKYTREEVWPAIQRVYTQFGMSDLLNDVRHYFE